MSSDQFQIGLHDKLLGQVTLKVAQPMARSRVQPLIEQPLELSERHPAEVGQAGRLETGPPGAQLQCTDIERGIAHPGHLEQYGEKRKIFQSFFVRVLRSWD